MGGLNEKRCNKRPNQYNPKSGRFKEERLKNIYNILYIINGYKI
jgi:hypothetical protein